MNPLADQLRDFIEEPADGEDRLSGLNLHEEVDVAVWRCIAACDRAEHAHATNPPATGDCIDPWSEGTEFL